MLRESAMEKIYAAWACDDKGGENGAISCRKAAAVALREANETGGFLFEHDPAADAVLMVDLLRRASEFEEAESTASSLLALDVPIHIQAMLELELELIARNDTGAHKCPSA